MELGSDEMFIYDAANMAFLPVELDFSSLSEALSVTWLEKRMERGEWVASFRVEATNGQTATGTVPIEETDTLENLGGLSVDDWYYMEPNEAGDGINLIFDVKSEKYEFIWFCEGEVPLELDPATKTFTISKSISLTSTP